MVDFGGVWLWTPLVDLCVGLWWWVLLVDFGGLTLLLDFGRDFGRDFGGGRWVRFCNERLCWSSAVGSGFELLVDFNAGRWC